jgi:hypothetical protein
MAISLNSSKAKALRLELPEVTAVDNANKVRRSGPDVKPEVGMVVRWARMIGVPFMQPDKPRPIKSLVDDGGSPSNGTVSMALWNKGAYDILSAPGYCATGPIADAPKDGVTYDVQPGLRFKILSTFLVTAVDGDRVTCVNEESGVVEIESMTVRKLQKELTVGGITFVGYAPVKDAPWKVGQRRRGVILLLNSEHCAGPIEYTVIERADPITEYDWMVRGNDRYDRYYFTRESTPSELIADAPAIACKGAPCGMTYWERMNWPGRDRNTGWYATTPVSYAVLSGDKEDRIWCSPECRDRAGFPAVPKMCQECWPAACACKHAPTKAPAPWKCAMPACKSPGSPRYANASKIHLGGSACVVCVDEMLAQMMIRHDTCGKAGRDHRAAAIASLASHIEPGTASALAASGASAWRPRHHGMFLMDPIDEV